MPISLPVISRGVVNNHETSLLQEYFLNSPRTAKQEPECTELDTTRARSRCWCDVDTTRCYTLTLDQLAIRQSVSQSITLAQIYSSADVVSSFPFSLPT